MSKIPANSYFIPRSLKQHPLWVSARPAWKLVYDWLMHHAVFSDTLEYNVNGRSITLRRGQCAYTLRQIADELKISKNEVEGAIKHFLGKNFRGQTLAQVSHGDCTCLLRQQLRQQLRHEKTVVDVLCEGYYEITQTTTQTTTQTATQTTLRQHSDTNKKDKKDKKDILSNNTPSFPLTPKKGDAASPLEGGGYEKSKGKRKEAAVYPGQISDLAHRMHQGSVKDRVCLSPDHIQFLLDDYGFESVRYALEEAAKDVLAGKRIIPRMYVPAILRNNFTRINSEKIINIKEA